MDRYNGMNGIVHTLEPVYARVEHTGKVFFSRPGTLDVSDLPLTPLPDRPSRLLPSRLLGAAPHASLR